MADPAMKLQVTADKKPVPAPAPFDTLRSEIDRVFESFGIGSWRFPFVRPAAELGMALPRDGGWGVTPAVDVAEKDGAYEITVELPGIDEKDIEVKVASGSLIIKGFKKEDKEEREKDYYLSERRYGSFMRSFGLPDGVDANRIAATFAKGVLKVEVPKTAEAKQSEKKIEIKAG